MKKVALLLSALFLFGCGAGGGTSTTGSTSGGTSGGSGSSSSSQSVTLKLVEGTKAAALFAADQADTATQANSVRIVARNVQTVLVQDVTYDGATDSYVPSNPPTYHSETKEIFRQVSDLNYTPGGSVTINLPVGYSYEIDVLTNALDGSGNHTMLKYGTTGTTNLVAVAAGATTSASITLNPLSALYNFNVDPGVGFTLPLSNAKYNLTVAPTAANTGNRPFSTNSIKVLQDLVTTNFISTTFSSSGKNGAIGSAIVFTAPSTTVPTVNGGSTAKLYFSGIFNIDSSMLDTGKNESNAKWVRIYPDPSLNENASCDLTILGSVTF